MSKPESLQWIGERDANGQPLEWFSGIPARDLTAEDIAELTADQWAALESPAGKRLYASKAAARPAAPAAGKGSE